MADFALCYRYACPMEMICRRSNLVTTAEYQQKWEAFTPSDGECEGLMVDGASHAAGKGNGVGQNGRT